MGVDSVSAYDSNDMGVDSVSAYDSNDMGVDSVSAYDSNDMGPDSVSAYDSNDVGPDSVSAYDSNDMGAVSVSAYDSNDMGAVSVSASLKTINFSSSKRRKKSANCACKGACATVVSMRPWPTKTQCHLSHTVALNGAQPSTICTQLAVLVH